MIPPDSTYLPREVVTAILERHRLRASVTDLTERQPWIGATSRVYPLGDVVLKVPHADPAAIAALRIDASVAPIVRAVGVRTPRLVAYDDSRDLLPVPYAVHQRVRGESLDRLGHEPEAVPEVWRELGRDLAIVHALSAADGPLAGLRTFEQSAEVDPRPWTEELAGSGHLTRHDARWLAGLLDRLAPAALAAVPRRLCHGDVNAGNVLVDAAGSSFLAVVDWAGAGWLDPVWDFAGIPLRAVPYLLEGHRQQAPLPADETAEARILWCHVQLALFHLRRQPPLTPAGTAQVTRLLTNVRHYLDPTDLG